MEKNCYVHLSNQEARCPDSQPIFMPVQNSSTDFQMARAQQCSRKRARVRQNCIFLPRFRGSIRQTFLLSNPSKRSNTTNHDRSAVQNRFDLLDRDKKKKKEEKKDIADKCNSRGTLCNLKRLKKEKKRKEKFSTNTYNWCI